jgi:hypothetical protein
MVELYDHCKKVFPFRPFVAIRKKVRQGEGKMEEERKNRVLQRKKDKRWRVKKKRR